jgi:hypothetical protein
MFRAGRTPVYSGGLISDGPDFLDQYQRAVTVLWVLRIAPLPIRTQLTGRADFGHPCGPAQAAWPQVPKRS